MKFLQKVAQHLVSQPPDNLHEALVITPSKRAELFLKTELADAISTPAIAPRFMTIEEWVESTTGTTLISGLPLLAELYATHLDLLGEEANSFEEFTKWGQSLLGDFNEVDRYRLDPSQVFANLRDAKVLERWGLMPEEEPTDLMENYLRFWEHINPLFEGFKKRLFQQNKTYQGSGFRLMSDRLDLLDQWIKEHNISQTYLVGFNALNACEELVFRHLLQGGKAEVLWDFDSYYTDHPHQEAGFFIREYLEGWPELKSQSLRWISEDWDTAPKSICVSGVSGSFAQAQKVSEIISGLPPEAIENQKVAVVLADEGLLIPVVDALPESVSSFNITMGLPLTETPLATFVLQLVSVLEKREKSGNSSFYYLDLVRLLEQPPLGEYLNHLGISAKAFIKKIHHKNWVYLSWKDVLKNLPELKGDALDHLMTEDISIKEWFSSGQAFFRNYGKQVSTDKIESESAYKLHSILGQLLLLVETHDFLQSFVQLKPFIKQSLSEDTLDFVGEPLEGLQVLGILETRLLDFDHVIMTSVNEGVLPKGKTSGSVIPLDLKRGFGLPTHKEKDAVYAYHFYRLLQGAKEVHLIYNVAPSEIGTREPSRFILQLQREWGHEPFQDFFIQTEDTYLPAKTHEEEYSVSKTPELLERLESIAYAKGFSPSSLTSYINNPLTFYKQRVLSVSEADEVEETIGDNTLGNYLHEVLEDLYTPHLEKGTLLQEDHIKNMFAPGKELLLKAFRKDFSEKSLQEGKNYLIFNVALEMLNTYLKAEQKRISDQSTSGHLTCVLELEKEYSCSLTEGEKPVVLKGLIDRIDSTHGITHILDYKTGTLNENDLKIKSDSLLTELNRSKDKAIQLICYGWMYLSENPRAQISLGIIGLRRSGVVFPLTIDRNKTVFTREDLEPFMLQIKKVIDEILDPSIPFILNPKSRY